jgi:hypothetical protein
MIKERVGTEIGLVTGRIKQSLRNGQESISELQNTLSAGTRRAVRRTDYYVHDNAWKMLGLAVGLAFVAGFVLSRRNQDTITASLEAGTSPEMEKKVRKRNSWEFVHSALPLALFFWKSAQASRCARKGLV